MPLFPWRRKARVKSDNLSQHDPKAFPSGIKELYCPSAESTVDIVFIHGLTGDRERTWTAKNASEPWPKTLLASKLPTARILTFGYDAYVADWKTVVSQNRIGNHSSNLLNSLAHYREEKEDTALCKARERTDSHFKSILRSVRGVVFLGTPHHGSSLAIWAERLSVYIGVVKQTNNKILEVLRKDSEVLARIQDGFHTMIQARNAERLESIKISCFYEELPLEVVVPQDSAIIPGYNSIGIHSNHMDMCRFGTADDPGFKSIYGELRRWSREMAVAGSPQGILSVVGTTSAPQNTPVGQDREENSMPQYILKQLESQLSHQEPCTNQPHHRIALYGLGGIGKTQIALAYIYWLKSTASDVSIFWVHASNTDRFRQAYAEIAEKCQVPGYDDPKADTLLLVKKWLEEKHQGRWLMVIDNADDAQLFCRPAKLTNADGEKCLGQYIPECSQGAVLITTRNKQVGLWLTKGMGPGLLGINKMKDVESCQLLRASLNNNLVATEELSTLACRLEQLPLALAQASAFIQENSITIQKYLQLLDKGDQSFVNLLSEEFATIGQDSDTPHAVAATWIPSFIQIEQQNPLACELLLLISLFDRQAIPMEFLSKFVEAYHNDPPIEDIELTKAIGILKAYSLITEENNKSLNLHRLIQLVTQKWLATKGTMRQFTEMAIVTVSYCYPFGIDENREKCAAYLPHVQAVLKLNGVRSRDEKIARATILHHAGAFFCLQGQWNLAETFQTEARDIRREILGPNHLDTLPSIGNLASTYRSQGRWKEAEILEVQVIDTYKATLGPDHPNTLKSMNNLASTYRDQGRWKEAEILGVQVMETHKATLGPDHPDTLLSMSNLASTYWNQGRWKEAEILGVQVMETHRAILGPDHLDTLISMSNLASTYWNQGRWKEAEILEVQVMETRKVILGPDHPNTLLSMNNLASMYWDQGRWKEAKILEVQVMETRKVILGPDYPDTLKSMNNLASMYWDQGRWKEAEILEVQVMETRKATLGPDHPDTLLSMNNLAYTWKSQGRIDDAIQLMENCVEATRRVIGEDHPYTVDSLSALTEWRTEQAAAA
ncbi:hypothetical protein FHL15_004676 [Xylaria flabelliformis]|uniref:NB-ARC domain-containing protein n=1 Tax=Xylaria flabelliformis TaxID=2512241 RepID=A0A553I2U6_9PEZI|nr:hypothetical protein FHL15_004676 [Xylaria flabelliformis]